MREILSKPLLRGNMSYVLVQKKIKRKKYPITSHIFEKINEYDSSLLMYVYNGH